MNILYTVFFISEDSFETRIIRREVELKVFEEIHIIILDIIRIKEKALVLRVYHFYFSVIIRFDSKEIIFENS